MEDDDDELEYVGPEEPEVSKEVKKEIRRLVKRELPNKRQQIERGLLEGILLDIALDGDSPGAWLDHIAKEVSKANGRR